MEFTLNKTVKETKAARESFFALADSVFGLSFHSWYARGYWGGAYIPYTLFAGETAVANVSGNFICTLVDGVPKTYLQIGTVMTHPAYRGRGLARRLLETMLADFGPRCDGVYLYANNTVLGFYPRFGFVPAQEYSVTKALSPAPQTAHSPFVPLDMENPANVALLEQYYRRGNPFSARPMLDNFGLVMFYCGAFLKNSVLYAKELDCIAIADIADSEMTCYELFCGTQHSMDTLLHAAARPATARAALGFLPKDLQGCTLAPAEDEDNQLFVLSAKENMFAQSKMLLPLLSHA